MAATAIQPILDQALDLDPKDRAQLIETLLDSFTSNERQRIDAAWAQECEDRIDAYDRGDLGSHSSEEVFADLASRFGER
ncbi:MAG: addiction module protein [Thermoanaerobaculia bacterium]|nr:addiction module protein [Thermoanaerobaculia bacterium]